MSDTQSSKRRLPWFPDQWHPGFCGSASCLSSVTSSTGADYIIPVVLPASVLRNHMIQCQFTILSPAILAGVLVSIEYLQFCHPPGTTRTPDKVHKADYRWYIETFINRMQIAAPVFQNFGFSSNDQDNSATYMANIQWLVVLIQYQNRKLNHCWYLYRFTLLYHGLYRKIIKGNCEKHDTMSFSKYPASFS